MIRISEILFRRESYVKGASISKGWIRYKRQWQLQLFVYLGLIWLIIFSWAPLFGITIAFKDYSIRTGVEGIFTSEFNHFQHFKDFFGYYNFNGLLRNTLVLSITKLLATFPAAILFAILINEVRINSLKRVIQTVSYLPHFISWVLVYTVSLYILGEKNGVVNDFLLRLGLVSKPVAFLSSEELFYGLAIFLSLWKTTGWNAIIFLASITNVDPTLYEAASVDGAGRLRRIWHITLPGILPAVVTVLVINIGSMLGGGMGGSNFEISYMFGNVANVQTSEIIQTYSFKMGLSKGRFAFATAVDLCQSILSIILVVSSNYAAKKISGSSLF